MKIEMKNMKNIKSFDDVNEGFMDSVKNFFTGGDNKNKGATRGSETKAIVNNENTNDSSLWVTKQGRVLVDFINLISNPKDGSMGSDSQLKTFLQTPAEGYGPYPDGTKKKKGDVIAGMAERIIKFANENSPESFTRIHKGHNFTYTLKDKIKKNLGI